MIGIIKPFFKILTKRKPVVSRLSIFRTLVLLALFKRTRKSKDTAAVRLGKYILYGPDYNTLSFLIKEKFVEEEYAFTAKTSKPIIIDCGANIGISVIYFKCLYPDAVIHCFEPYVRAFKFLELNVIENKLDGVFLYQMALAGDNEMKSLYIPDSGYILNASLCSFSGHVNANVVQSMRLSDFTAGYKSVDLVKMDVEGAEDEIIRDFFLNKNGNKVHVHEFVIEYHHSIFKDERRLEDFKRIFEVNNYSVKSRVLYPQKLYSDLFIRCDQNE